MKAVITKQQFIEKIGPEKRRSLEKRLGIDLDSEITIEEIYDLIKLDMQSIEKDCGIFEDNFSTDTDD